MRKEFESELAKKVSGHKKRSGKAWVLVAISAAILISGAAAFTVAAEDQQMAKLKLQDGSCTDSDCDGDQVCDEDCTSDCDGDQVCDEDCTSDCDGDQVCDEDCTSDCDGDQVCDEDCTSDCDGDQVCDEDCTSDCDGICDGCLNECDECTCDGDQVCDEVCDNA